MYLDVSWFQTAPKIMENSLFMECLGRMETIPFVDYWQPSKYRQLLLANKCARRI